MRLGVTQGRGFIDRGCCLELAEAVVAVLELTGGYLSLNVSWTAAGSEAPRRFHAHGAEGLSRHCRALEKRCRRYALAAQSKTRSGSRLAWHAFEVFGKTHPWPLRGGEVAMGPARLAIRLPAFEKVSTVIGVMMNWPRRWWQRHWRSALR